MGAELIHARWAMLGALGALVPEGLEYFGSNNAEYSVWWKSGAALLEGGPGLNYAGINIPVPLVVIAAAEAALMLGAEQYRAAGEGPAGVAEDKLYPGGKYFDPLGLADDPDGFAVQAAVTKEGPFNNWAGHLSDPFGYNIVTIL